MLAQNFMTPTDLGISEAEHNALRLTLNALERGELRHVRPARHSNLEAPFTGHFNMDCWRASGECGTVACLGGTAEMLGQLPVHSLYVAMSANRELRNLFYPTVISCWNEITSDQAATALHSFLTTGNSNWREACPALASS